MQSRRSIRPRHPAADLRGHGQRGINPRHGRRGRHDHVRAGKQIRRVVVGFRLVVAVFIVIELDPVGPGRQAADGIGPVGDRSGRCHPVPPIAIPAIGRRLDAGQTRGAVRPRHPAADLRGHGQRGVDPGHGRRGRHDDIRPRIQIRRVGIGLRTVIAVVIVELHPVRPRRQPADDVGPVGGGIGRRHPVPPGSIPAVGHRFDPRQRRGAARPRHRAGNPGQDIVGDPQRDHTPVRIPPIDRDLVLHPGDGVEERRALIRLVVLVVFSDQHEVVQRVVRPNPQNRVEIAVQGVDLHRPRNGRGPPEPHRRLASFVRHRFAGLQRGVDVRSRGNRRKSRDERGVVKGIVRRRRQEAGGPSHPRRNDQGQAREADSHRFPFPRSFPRQTASRRTEPPQM